MPISCKLALAFVGGAVAWLGGTAWLPAAPAGGGADTPQAADTPQTEDTPQAEDTPEKPRPEDEENARDQARGKTARQEKDAYTLQSTFTPAPLKKGNRAVYRLDIRPKGDWVLKLETPFNAQLSSSKGLEPAQKQFSVDDFVDPDAKTKSIKTKITGTQSGSANIRAEVTFFLCTETICKRMQDELTLRVTID